MITGNEGVQDGQWTDEEAATGCTVVLLPEGTVASGEVRGGAPATRDFALLDPTRMVDRLDAVVLSGGSAFGLAACSGVMDVLERSGVGFETSAGPVPIVVGMSLFDLGGGDGAVRPTAAEGAMAAQAATGGGVPPGQVGGVTGETVGMWRGPDSAAPGGLGAAIVRSGEVEVMALIAVNASGDIDDGVTVAAVAAGDFVQPDVTPFVENTTIGVIVTNATLSKLDCHLVAQTSHDGFGRALVPAHTQGDGDAVVCASTGVVEGDVALVRNLALVATERAIRSIAAM